MATKRIAAFSMIELVIAMVLTAIVVGITSQIIVNPINIYMAVSDRITLTDDLDFVMQKVARDINQAAPNSVRLVTGDQVQTLEFLHVAAAGRYNTGSDVDSESLDFTKQDSEFVVFDDWSDVLTDEQLTKAHLLIYNNSLYELDNGKSDYDKPVRHYNAYSYLNYDPAVGHVMTNYNQMTLNQGMLNATAVFTQVSLLPGHRFALESSSQRVYLIDTPVSYQCIPDPERGKGTFTRYAGYTIQAQRQLFPADAQHEHVLLNNVHRCEFIYDPELQQEMSAPLLTLVIEIGDIDGEIIELNKRIVINNAS